MAPHAIFFKNAWKILELRILYTKKDSTKLIAARVDSTACEMTKKNWNHVLNIFIDDDTGLQLRDVGWAVIEGEIDFFFTFFKEETNVWLWPGMYFLLFL